MDSHFCQQKSYWCEAKARLLSCAVILHRACMMTHKEPRDNFAQPCLSAILILAEAAAKYLSSAVILQRAHVMSHMDPSWQIRNTGRYLSATCFLTQCVVRLLGHSVMPQRACVMSHREPSWQCREVSSLFCQHCSAWPEASTRLLAVLSCCRELVWCFTRRPGM